MDNLAGGEGQAVADTNAGGLPEGIPPVDKLFESDDVYERTRSDIVSKHGEAAWHKYLNGEMKPAERVSDKQNGNGKAVEEDVTDAGDDAESDEITINADGKAYDKRTGKFVPKSVVPKSAFLRVKGEVGEAKRTTEALTAELIRARERLSILTEAAEAGKPAKEAEADEAPIDPKEDLVGALNQALKQIAALKGETTKTAAENKAAHEARELQDYTMNDARRFTAQTPDFQAALTHAIAVQTRIKGALGMDEATAKKAISSELKTLIAEAKRSGKSWSQAVYSIAKEFGYQKPAEGGETEAEKAAREEIERINNGKSASQSLRGAGSGGVGEQFDRNKIAQMSEDEYFATRRTYVGKHGKAAWDKMMLG